MIRQSLNTLLVRGQAVLCVGEVVRARLGISGLAVSQTPESQLPVRPRWTTTEPEADPQEDYPPTADAAKRAGRSVRTAGVLSSRTSARPADRSTLHGRAWALEGSGLTAATDSERCSVVASVGKVFPVNHPNGTAYRPLMAMLNRQAWSRPVGRKTPASGRGQGL
jgi:hypothetical protein